MSVFPVCAAMTWAGLTNAQSFAPECAEATKRLRFLIFFTFILDMEIKLA